LALVAIFFSSVIVSSVVINQTITHPNETNTPVLPDDFVEELINGITNESIENGSIVEDNKNEGIDDITGSVIADENKEEYNQTVGLNETEEEISNDTKVISNKTINFSIETNVLDLNKSEIVTEIDSTIFTSRDLAVIDSPNSYDVEYAEQYLNIMKNFSDFGFEAIEVAHTTMKSRNLIDDIRAYKIADKNYAIHLLGCSASDFSCVFRINGVPTGILREGDTFDLNDGYTLRITSITIDYCDEARFCDLIYEAYDLVEIEVVRR